MPLILSLSCIRETASSLKHMPTITETAKHVPADGVFGCGFKSLHTICHMLAGICINNPKSNFCVS
jgi:hypothetical protein